MSGPSIQESVRVFQSPDDRRLIAAEAAADPVFARKVSAMLSQPDGESQVVAYAKKAILNEMDPSLYPETSGQWPKLRAAASKLTTELPKVIVDMVNQAPPEDRPAALQELSARCDEVLFGMGELGQLEIIGQLIGAVASAGVSLYDAQLQSSTQKQIASMQLQANEQAIQAQEAEAAAQTAVAKAQAAQATQATLPPPAATAIQNTIEALPTALQAPVASIVTMLSTDIGGGIPLWLAGLTIYLITKK